MGEAQVLLTSGLNLTLKSMSASAIEVAGAEKQCDGRPLLWGRCLNRMRVLVQTTNPWAPQDPRPASRLAESTGAGPASRVPRNVPHCFQPAFPGALAALWDV